MCYCFQCYDLNYSTLAVIVALLLLKSFFFSFFLFISFVENYLIETSFMKVIMVLFKTSSLSHNHFYFIILLLLSENSYSWAGRKWFTT